MTVEPSKSELLCPVFVFSFCQQMIDKNMLHSFQYFCQPVIFQAYLRTRLPALSLNLSASQWWADLTFNRRNNKGIIKRMVDLLPVSEGKIAGCGHIYKK